ncbi:hypothetical protein BFW38_02000 [Terasakiispira papahanaumokuakeensis]|uniref:DUF4234 domain-containing protein n=1 Tax=Terasakiispira papahanaumokuakeensis TaxID=197479 RepID=A0A1E2V685_9GAMM|nr:DUF4234 domain-containing protein [Terasakiispira papahanaumokuakeensis]ODC02499.1 hypothetical protein BFW38_02000 [Terasakiispira papahanaumokuakeensis]
MTDGIENPYVAPQADLEVHRDPGDLSVFPRFSTWLVLLLSIVTLGIYAFWWIYDRTRKLNTISEDKLPMGLVKTYIIFSVLGTFLPIIFTIVMINSAQSSSFALVSLLGNLLSFVGFVLLEIWAFQFRNRLNSLTHSQGQKTWAGGVMTFFFTALYMSYKINQHLDRRS